MAVVPTLETDRVLARLETNLGAVRSAEFERLTLAREWALAQVITDPEQLRDSRRRPTPLGAVGLPVDEYAAAELAAALELHPLAGRALMADAVDLEARLPELWAACGAGRIEVWVARKIASATSRLSPDQAAWVDRSIAEVVGTLPASRLLRLVEARVVEADQALADRLAEEQASARTVWMSRHDEHGTRTLMVRGESAGVRRFHGTVDHLAHLLAEHGTPEQRSLTMDQLRAEAVVLLANPLVAPKLMVGVDKETDHPIDHPAASGELADGGCLRAPRPTGTPGAWRRPGGGDRSADPPTAHRPPRPPPDQPATRDRPQRRDGRGLLRGASRDRRAVAAEQARRRVPVRVLAEPQPRPRPHGFLRRGRAARTDCGGQPGQAVPTSPPDQDPCGLEGDSAGEPVHLDHATRPGLRDRRPRDQTTSPPVEDTESRPPLA